MCLLCVLASLISLGFALRRLKVSAKCLRLTVLDKAFPPLLPQSVPLLRALQCPQGCKSTMCSPSFRHPHSDSFTTGQERRRCGAGKADATQEVRRLSLEDSNLMSEVDF